MTEAVIEITNFEIIALFLACLNFMFWLNRFFDEIDKGYPYPGWNS